MGKHALLSASKSSQWLACTPSARYGLQFPSTTSTHAEEGTAAHELSELAASYQLGKISKTTYDHRLKDLKKGKYYTAEMMEHALDYSQYIEEIVETARETCSDTVVELEAKNLDFSEWAPEGFGTGDCIIVSDDLLEIIDFKYGRGVRVDAYNNPQMRLYALGALQRYGALYDIKRVRMTIIQPRINREPSTEELTIEELMTWAEEYVKPRAALAFAGEGDFCPDDNTCKFCPAEAYCKARADKNLALFDDAPDLQSLTIEEVGAILEKASDIRAWLKNLEDRVTKTLFEGIPVEGWKLVEGRSNRKFVDEDKVAEAMLSAGYQDALIYERSLITLAAMEKAFGKKAVGEILKDLIYKPPGKPALVPASDKREEFKPEALILDAFEEE